MSLKDERSWSIINTRNFLRRILSPYGEKGIKRLPKSVRQEAGFLLKHFPSDWELARALRKGNKYICEKELKNNDELERRKDMAKLGEYLTQVRNEKYKCKLKPIAENKKRKVRKVEENK